VKTLVLVRHGKSSWEFPGLSDKDRPLKKRGVNDAKIILDQLKQTNWQKPKAISSPAKRAFDTATLICQGLKIEPTIDDRLYFEGTEAILDSVVDHAAGAETVFCFGHQPNTAELYSQLTSDNLDHIPTTGVAIIDFEIASWSEIKTTTGNARALLFPKMFK